MTTATDNFRLLRKDETPRKGDGYFIGSAWVMWSEASLTIHGPHVWRRPISSFTDFEEAGPPSEERWVLKSGTPYLEPSIW